MAVTPYSPPPAPAERGHGPGAPALEPAQHDSGELDLLMSMIAEPGGGGGGEPPLPWDPAPAPAPGRPPAPRPPAAAPPRGPDGVTARGWLRRGRGRGRSRRGPRRARGRRAHAHRRTGKQLSVRS